MDTLLRLAEEPSFYTPKWSSEILAEVRRTLTKWGRAPRQVDRRIDTMESAFPDALVHGFDAPIPAMTNDVKDRHILAAAVKCGAHMTATEFLEHQYHLDPDAFIKVLTEQAANIDWTLPQLIARHVPALSELIRAR